MFLSRKLSAELHVVYPATSTTLRLIDRFITWNGLVCKRDVNTVSIEQIDDGYVFRISMPNDGKSVHASVGVPHMTLDQTEVYCELQNISDAYIAAIFFA